MWTRTSGFSSPILIHALSSAPFSTLVLPFSFFLFAVIVSKTKGDFETGAGGNGRQGTHGADHMGPLESGAGEERGKRCKTTDKEDEGRTAPTVKQESKMAGPAVQPEQQAKRPQQATDGSHGITVVWGKKRLGSIGEFVCARKRGDTKSNGIYFFPKRAPPFGYAL
jgi:hypothetical protein